MVVGRAAAGICESVPSVVRGRGFGSSTRSRSVGGTKRPVGLVTADVATFGGAGGVDPAGVVTGGATSGSRATGAGEEGSTASGGVGGTTLGSTFSTVAGDDVSATMGVSSGRTSVGGAADGGADGVSTAA